MNATYAVCMTPTGRSAIAVVLVTGPKAVDAVDACFLAANGRRLADQPLHRIRFGRWGHDQGEELVVCRRASTDNEQQVEIHCHGGRAAVRAVLDRLVEQGCVEGDWREQVARSAPNLIAAEATEALAEATTQRTAGILLDQLNGALETALREIIAHIDRHEQCFAIEKTEALLAWRRLGERLTRPWKVVLAGPPNVGKSSLINALVGYQRAIVFDQPGTTRDVVTAETAIDGWPITLADTAGLRDATDTIEAAGVSLARKILSEADLVLLVQEATTTTEQAVAFDASVTQHLDPEGKKLVVANKIDLATSSITPWSDVTTNALSSAGIEALVKAIGQALVPECPAASAAVPFTPRQIAALESAHERLQGEDFSSAKATMQSLLAKSSL